ncbi:unnamed protein product [Ceutorhynchus assimilis]|uniref:Uncharacterized protein n=1 Tax=Ceutorhynchus assimilis TaxID=467358 RepID=A0A9N9MJJ4_9CUCU|nr:unnamed protein product [Ceutorhynchus assimilis]
MLKSFTALSTAYGIDHEPIAVKEFGESLEIDIKPCGFFVDENDYYLGAAPDGLVEPNEMAGTRGRKILEMVYKINTTSNDRQNDETIVDLNQVPPQQDILYYSNESSEFNSTSATDQLSNSEILKRETNLHQMPPEDENTLPSTSTHQSSSSDSDSDSSSSDSCSSSEDFSRDDSLKDPNYNDSSSSSSSEVIPEEVELQKKRKRKADQNTWEKTAAKIRRNSGKEYVSSSKSKRIYGAKKIGKACTNKCRL